MATSLRFLAVGLLMAGTAYHAAAQSLPLRSSTGNTAFPFFVGAQWFEGDYELSGLPNLPISVAPSGYENAVKPWQLTVGRNVSSRLAIQVGYTYASTKATENTTYTNPIGQPVNSSVRYETLINSLPWLGRYDLIPRSHAMHVDLLLGITGLTAQSIVSSEDRVNGQVVASQRTTSRISRLYGTGGVGFHYPFGGESTACWT